MTDRTTKILLVIIALGLWVNVFWTHDTLSDIAGDVSSMQSDVSSMQTDISSVKSDVSGIEDGTCTNDKICP